MSLIMMMIVIVMIDDYINLISDWCWSWI